LDAAEKSINGYYGKEVIEDGLKKLSKEENGRLEKVDQAVQGLNEAQFAAINPRFGKLHREVEAYKSEAEPSGEGEEKTPTDDAGTRPSPPPTPPPSTGGGEGESRPTSGSAETSEPGEEESESGEDGGEAVE
jgi:hypothetical protein